MVVVPQRELASYPGEAKEVGRQQRKEALLKKGLGFWLGFLLFVFAGGALLAWETSLLNAKGYYLRALEEEVRALEEENAKLRLEVAGLKAPVRIASLAQEKLAMASADPQQVTYLPLAGAPAASPAPQASSPAEKEPPSLFQKLAALFKRAFLEESWAR